MKTKEEILLSVKNANNNLLTNYISPDGYVWKMILEAMQEYADQEVNKVIANLNYTLD